MLNIIFQQIYIEVYLSINKIEKYYIFIHYVYKIIHTETHGTISKISILQIVFKVINNTTSSNSLVLTLFIIGTYLYIIINLLPLPS